LTLKSDDVTGRESLDGNVFRPGTPEAAERLLFTLRAAGFVPEYTGSEKPALSVRLATPQDIRNWSYGEVKKPETINNRTCRPEKDGLFCERIFGPVMDLECACGKYRGNKYTEMVCDRCGVKVTHSRVRRRRCGHVELAVPVVHPWFLADAAALARLIGLDEVLLRRIAEHRAFVVAEPGRSGYAVGDVIDDYAHDMARYDDEQYEAEGGGAGVRLLLKRAAVKIWRRCSGVSCRRRGFGRWSSVVDPPGRARARQPTLPLGRRTELQTEAFDDSVEAARGDPARRVPPVAGRC
jgi:hypothetical protein